MIMDIEQTHTSRLYTIHASASLLRKPNAYHSDRDFPHTNSYRAEIEQTGIL